jgi:hypothetical protein
LIRVVDIVSFEQVVIVYRRTLAGAVHGARHIVELKQIIVVARTTATSRSAAGHVAAGRDGVTARSFKGRAVVSRALKQGSADQE